MNLTTRHAFDLVACMAVCALLQPLLQSASASDENLDGSVAAFMGPLPGTTYVYQYFWNGALTDGQEGLVKGIAREKGSSIRVQIVTRLAKGPSGAPVEDKAEQILRVSDESLEAVNSEGKSVVLLSGPLKVGRTWTREAWSWRPTSPQQSSGSDWTKVESKHGNWTASSAACRVQQTYAARVFNRARTIVVVSCNVKTSAGIQRTSNEEWASGVGLVRAVESAKDPSGRDLGNLEQRLERVQESR